MSKSPLIAILFDGDSGNVFHAGQLVTGHVHVETSKQIKMRGIRLQVTGQAVTSWTERSGDDEKSFSGREEYMNFEIYFIGSRNNTSELYLEPSVYSYPFSFILHPELPQSFSSLVGNIRYTAKAVIDRPMRIDDKAEVQFLVIHLLDLNREPPQLREPMVMHEQTLTNGCCCVDGFIEFNATVNKGCFAPGEAILIDGEIVNRTNTDSKCSTVALIQTVEYYTAPMDGRFYDKTSSTTVLASVCRPKLQRGQTDSWKNISLVVPQVVSTRLDGCRIINIRHSIVISIDLNAAFNRYSVSCPVVLGNIPIRDDYAPFVVASQPMAYPASYNIATGHMPPTYIQPTAGTEKTAFDTYNNDSKDLPRVHMT